LEREERREKEKSELEREEGRDFEEAKDKEQAAGGSYERKV